MPPEPTPHRLLIFARKLLPAATFTDLLAVARDEARAVTGYDRVWLMVADDEEARKFRMLDFAGDNRDVAWELAPVLSVDGDPFLEELAASDVPIVIEDARTDPRTNKQLVELLQNRTLINIPLRLLDKPLGFLGLGTFGDEGCRAPSPAELDYLVGMATQVALAAGRIRFIEARMKAEKDRLELERRVANMQKLESLGMLAGGVAHDFNNLLTVILSSAALAAETTDRAVVQEEIGSIVAAAERARALTAQLLAMSHGQGLRLEPTDVNERLTSLRDLLQRVLPETIEIDLILGNHLPLVEGDRSQLDQVFMNICINARDAMSSGGRVTIETEQVLINGKYAETYPWAKPGRYVLITITDTGAGMSRDVLDKIFEPFFTTKGPQTGTGLGLAVSYGIVRQHGGMLHCYSEVGVGSTFKVYLPATERLAASVGTKLAAKVPRARANERILVAEDDAGVRAVALRILQRADYAVTSVESGEAAAELAGREDFALVILDVVTPGKSCREVVIQLREAKPALPIILASGYAPGDNLAELIRDFGVEFLRKPFDPDGLLRTIRRVLDGAS